MQTALAAGLLAGNALALLGLFVLLRGVAFSGLAVSQLAALGAVAGALLGVHFSGFWFALACVAAGLVLMERLRAVAAPQDTWVAGLYLLAAAAAVLLLSKAPHGEAHTMSIFFGNVLSLGQEEVAEAAGLLLLVLVPLALRLHGWVWLSFDRVAAAVSGLSVRLWTVGFLALFSFAMTLGIHLFGVLLAFALLLAPGAVALLWARRMWQLFALVPAVASLAVIAGLDLSFRWDFPAGPLVAGLLAAAILASGVLRLLIPE